MSKKLARETIKKRMEQVKMLYFCMHYTADQVAKALDSSPATIWRDIQKIRSKVDAHIREQLPEEILVMNLLQKDNLIKKLLSSFDNLEPHHKPRMALAVNEIENDKMEILRRFGILSIGEKSPNTQVVFNFAQAIEEGAQLAIKRVNELRELAIRRVKEKDDSGI